MFCRNCGAQVNDDAKFCNHCGSKVEINEETNATPESQAASDPRTEQVEAEPIVGPHPSAVSVLIWGIVGLVCSIEFGIVGMILSIIGKKKHTAYINSGAPMNSKVSIGGKLSKIGIIVGIVMAVFWVLYFAFWFIIGFIMGIAEVASIFSIFGFLGGY